MNIEDPRSLDPRSIYGKSQVVERQVQLVVVGGGVAGIAAATEASRAGVETLLIDENPIDMNMMALDVPLYFGQRILPTVRDRASMLQRVVSSSEGLEEAEEAGVELMLGHYVWGAFRNSKNVRELSGSMVGVADDERTWCIGYERLIVASGARDMGMAFGGWEKVGTMGANGAWSLMGRYQALTAQRVVILGSGNVGLRVAEMAMERGMEVVGVVEVGPEVLGDGGLREKVEGRGVKIYTAHTVKGAIGSGEEIEGLEIVEVGGDLKPVGGSEKRLECDTVVLSLGLVPNIELLNLLGVDLPFRSERGGYAPEVDEWMRTSVPSVYVCGDAAGFEDGMVLDESIAREQGRLAGIAAAESLGTVDSARAREVRGELGLLNEWMKNTHREVHSHYRRWLVSLLNVEGWGVYTCQCEEVTRRELADVQPPRYLEWESEQMSGRSLKTLVGDGPVNQDQIKRLTRVGMGYCQGRRCREQAALLLAEESGIDVSEIPLPTYRAPVRPLPLRVMYADDESQETRDNWTGWFGIRSQWTQSERQGGWGEGDRRAMGLGRTGGVL